MGWFEMNVKNGFAHVYCCFDVANFVELDKIKKILNKQPEESPIQLDKLSPTYMQYAEPPLLLQLGKKTLKLDDFEVSSLVSAKIYPFGVVSIIFRIPLKGSLESIKKAAVELGDSKGKIVAEAKTFLARLLKDMTESLVKPNPQQENDVLMVFHVREFEEKVSAQEFLKKNSEDIAVLLTSEDKDLSDKALSEVLKNNSSYYKNDLAIAYGNAAFLIDPSEAFDMLDIMEFAFTQGIELRLFDSLLDKELDKAYDEVEKSGKAGFFYNYEAARDGVAQLRLEVSEVVEKVDNALKLVGDSYLARVYALASNALHLHEWRAGIEAKLDSLEYVYEVLDDKAHSKRDLKFWVVLTVLEVLITLLIALEFFV